jgi:ribonuclease HII
MGVDDYNVKCVVKADATIPTVMAASILAKTNRDELMHTISNPITNTIGIQMWGFI